LKFSKNLTVTNYVEVNPYSEKFLYTYNVFPTDMIQAVIEMFEEKIKKKPQIRK
jgi:hypothetical protein